MGFSAEGCKTAPLGWVLGQQHTVPVAPTHPPLTLFFPFCFFFNVEINPFLPFGKKNFKDKPTDIGLLQRNELHLWGFN